MSTPVKVILISAWFIAAMAFLASNIWGRMAERTYAARMSPAWRWFLMPGRLRDKDVWVRFQKAFSWFGLFFVTLVYALALISVLR
jgi:hypothetical protein